MSCNHRCRCSCISNMNPNISKYNKEAYIKSFYDDAIKHFESALMRVSVMAYIVVKGVVYGPFFNGPLPNPRIDAGSLHAEINCIRQFFGEKGVYNPYKGHKQAKNADKKINSSIKAIVIVVRFDKTMKMKSARPCRDCLSAMKAYGIKKVHYTTDNGNIVVENISDMYSIHHSFVALKHHKITYPKSWISTKVHFIKSLINLPSSMKKYNFFMLWKHNLRNVLPMLQYNIKKNVVHIMDDSNNLLIKIQLS